MLSRSSFGRTAQRALRTQSASSRRAFASAAQYETAEAAGIKVANRELEGATSLLAVVAKAGSRYEPVPGFSDALARYAFQVCHYPRFCINWDDAYICCSSLHTNDRLCVSLARQSF